MERRNFLKNIFGAALVAAMPKIIVGEIEEKAPIEKLPVKKEFKHLNNVLYVYDDKTLIGATANFEIVKYKTVNFMTSTLLYDLFSEKIICEKFKWININKALNGYYIGNPFNIVIKKDGAIITGVVYFKSISTDIQYYDKNYIESDLEFAVFGHIEKLNND